MLDKSLLALSGVRQKFPLLAGLAVLQALVILGQALFLSQAVVDFWQGRGFNRALPFMLGFALCFLAREGVILLRNRLLDNFAYQLSQDLRGQLLDKVFEIGPMIASEMGSGSLATTAISGIDTVETYIKLVLSKVLNMMIVPVLILIPIFFLDWQSGLVLLIAFPFAIIFMILLGYAAQSRAEKQYASFQLLSNHFLDSLRGIATLRYFGLSKGYADSIYKTSERFRKATMRTLQMAMLSTFALDFFATLSVATVALFLGLRLMNGQILLFSALAALILAPEYFLPLREFASDYHATLNGKNALAAINKVLSAGNNTENETPMISTEAANLPTWSATSQLTLSHLTKTFETGRGVNDVSIRLSGYQKVAVIGASGSGKSTLLNVLSGFLAPTGGGISLNNRPLTSLADSNWRSLLSFIPQSTYIFAGKLRENLAFYESAATDKEIKAAAKAAGLENLLNEIGLDELIGSAGRTLSGGQMQRVALTRAFLAKNRPILLLDEPTAHLDIETELEIKENILPLFDNKLVFLATHRLHWLPQMDQVIVLNEGKVEGIGTHEELLATNAYYQELLTQMRGSNPRNSQTMEASL